MEKEKDDLHHTFESLRDDMKLNVLFQQQRTQEKLLKEQNRVLCEIKDAAQMKRRYAALAAIFTFIGMAAMITTCNKVKQSRDNRYDLEPEIRSAQMPNAYDSTKSSSDYVLTL